MTTNLLDPTRVTTHTVTKARNIFFATTELFNLNELTMEKIKTTDKASISITRVKSVLVGLKETERNRVLIADDNGWC